MLYELRTTVRGGGTRDLARALGDSTVFGAFQTEVGETGRMVIVRPQEGFDLHGPPVVRGEGRREARGADLFGRHDLELLAPAPFMRPLEPCTLGSVWELRWYDYPAGTVDDALDSFGRAMAMREELSPVVGCWKEAVGPYGDRIYLLSPFRDWDQYDEIRASLRKDRSWLPRTPSPLGGGAKILLPTAFSRLR